MIQVWLYNENKMFTETVLVNEVDRNMTTVPLLIGCVKPTFNEELQEWYEGATDEEIQQWKDENTVVQEPTEVEILTDKISILQEENMSLGEYILTLEMKNIELENRISNIEKQA